MAASITAKRWTRLEYERMVDLGVFKPGDRIELVGGQLVVREPQATPHSTGIRLVARALRAAFGPESNVDQQLPVALDDEDRKSTRLNSSHVRISYAVFCLKK